MKKRYTILICFAAIICIGGVVALAATAPREKQSEYSDATGQVKRIQDHEKFITENVKDAEAGALAVPTYFENDILRKNDNSFYIGRDHGRYAGRNSRVDYFDRILVLFPSSAIRESADKKYIYVMYDTDQNNRIFLYFSKEKDEYFALDGFPVIMQKKLSFNDFSSLKIGDHMESAGEIDPVISLYKADFDTASDAAIKNYSKSGSPPTSIHLLTDGILKIEYDRVDGGYVITNIVYNKDFTLNGLNGKTCYKILEEDYIAAKK